MLYSPASAPACLLLDPLAPHGAPAGGNAPAACNDENADQNAVAPVVETRRKRADADSSVLPHSAVQLELTPTPPKADRCAAPELDSLLHELDDILVQLIDTRVDLEAL